jgi:hypothetical protein
MSVYRQDQVPSANNVLYVVTVPLASIMVQLLVMDAKAFSGGQSARIICTHAGKQKPNLLSHLILRSVTKTTEDRNK